VSQKDISSYVHAYNTSKLVMLIYEQTLIPSYILNAPVYQEAINVQADLMRTAKSEKVRQAAADSILNHLKRPEPKKIELDIGVKENGAVAQLQETMRRFAEEQRRSIAEGTFTVIDVAHSDIIPEDDDEYGL